MKKLLVIGSASLDMIHLPDYSVTTAGGAGMYTAMAAHRCGAQVSLFGVRPEDPPKPLQPVAHRLSEWLGPPVSLEQLPQFEISYRSGKTEYLQIFLDTEKALDPSLLPADLSTYDLIHVTPLGDAQVQVNFIEACRQRGAACISAGTGLFIAERQPQLVGTVMEQADYFFMNELEAELVCGSLEKARTDPGKVLFITQGSRGACIVQGDFPYSIPAVPTVELDPTGAGDAFCGVALSFLLINDHPVMAAHKAAALAAEMITQVGPAALLLNEPPPELQVDGRAHVNSDQIRKVAETIPTIPGVAPFPFISPELPPESHPKTGDYFFAATLQQFSFWSTQDNHYHLPLIAPIGGVELKGSDYLWAAYSRAMERDPEFCSVQRQADLTRDDILDLYRDDNGNNPMPALDLHHQQANSYGRDMLALNLTPQSILDQALASPEPLQTFLHLLGQVGGYKEDPLRKKSSLLVIILNDRPEKFLPLRDDEEVPPIIDYHLMRSFLRVGLVNVLDESLRAKLIARELVSPAEEWAIRAAAYRADESIIELSGKRTSEVDRLFFTARKYCPEMSEPVCSKCLVDSICAHRKELFQPVIRTTDY